MTLLQPGTFICFQGTLGSGKTLNMTALGARAFASGQKIYANYPTRYATRLNSLQEMMQVRNAVLLLDELQSILDSREFKNNTALSQWILIVRKLGLSILYTTQFLGQVDLRVRHVTEYVYCCAKTEFRGSKATKVTVVKWFGESGRVARSYVLPHSKELYSLYDTYDYEVKLTKAGRVASFNIDDVK
jgi:Zonular occludens toxin (Zot)